MRPVWRARAARARARRRGSASSRSSKELGAASGGLLGPAGVLRGGVARGGVALGGETEGAGAGRHESVASSPSVALSPLERAGRLPAGVNGRLPAGRTAGVACDEDVARGDGAGGS
ncbi:MAG: hypothetical protein M5U28_12065 [Sandaracinaceae bacterium]|nr:hypothetical protein [Sandaracinaceae bacterium]